ncbi:ribokinase [Paractinoplanes abujensis]|uniref:Sugar/nucleoside kinase (Ribokinase family) n=1 Tax=Paractinoplanes abujensis TaxID=882441 RepID=A0A7W7CKQ7_9ACTN|nr:PfkB family carbohydrate kinase [Actinoplanes abujensis]MBB4690313.1 sugar/nucleoside kinase (ribokinase family) [Actinoplanes abujensis]GID21076.1 ribokinase [Actinoplanes abujensis]
MILCVGLATVDLVYRVERVPGVDEKAQARSAEVAAGGPALNAAITAAALGAPVTLVTAIGAHPLGDLIRKDLEAHAVRLVDAAHGSEELPPVSTVIVADGTGERTIVSRNAGDRSFPVPEEGLPEAELTLVDGHHPGLAVAAARAARRLVVDAGTWRPVFADILPHADVVACSAAFRSPAALTAPDVIVTHGPGPVLWTRGGRTDRIEVPPVEAADTAGAGDAFHGALAFSLHAGQPVRDAITEAIRVAGVRVRHPGPRSWLNEL